MFTDHESMCLRHAWHHVLPNLPRGTGAVYVLDNASNNKKIEDGLGGRTSEEIQDWINALMVSSFGAKTAAKLETMTLGEGAGAFAHFAQMLQRLLPES